jgi:hypothetical protein
LHRTVCRLFLFLIVCAWLQAAESLPSVTVPEPLPAAIEDEPLPAVIEDEPLPVLPEHAISPVILDAELQSLRRARMLAGCKVAPPPEIQDPEALEFEKNADTAPVDVDDLMPNAAQALDTLKDLVTSVGGTFELRSAYRPPAYQAHLHQVWVKWVKELRNNRSSGCRALREEVGAEFARHRLLLKQQPVPDSDHAVGLAFDAAVKMPRAARLNGKRVSVDKLAFLAGTKRPSIRRDPGHFKVLSERPIAIAYPQASGF